MSAGKCRRHDRQEGKAGRRLRDEEGVGESTSSARAPGRRQQGVLGVGYQGSEETLVTDQVWSVSSFNVRRQVLRKLESSLVRFLAHDFLDGPRQRRTF